MKRSFLVACILAIGGSCFAQNPVSALIPMPNNVVVNNGNDLSLRSVAKVLSDLPADSPAMRELHSVFKHRLDVDLSKPQKKGATVEVRIDKGLKGEEHYRISTNGNTLKLTGASPEAIYRAVTTLDQILMGDAVRRDAKSMARVTIDDQPRIGRRALMLDPARHFLPVEDVKRYIDEMARYKYNVLQLHLTDDEGWRMEVKSHPELTSKGEYYTQAQLKDLVKYAADRYIEVVPELDVPGHTRALLAVHPELGCTVTDTVARNKIRGNNVMVCASQKSVYKLYDDIIGEVAEMFPSQYIHLGGDEAAVERNWALCDLDRELMKKEGYEKPSDIMNYFFGKVLDSVRKRGKTAILWCENDNIRMPAKEYLFPYHKDVVLVTWRNGLTPLCQKLTKENGHKLIMAPGETAYFDYPQYKNDLPEHNNWGMPTTTLQQAYTLDPSDNENIVGVMGTLWGEAINDINRACYMTYPRALALAEAGWTQMPQRSWESFKKRIRPVLDDMLSRGISYRAPFEIYRK